MAHATHPADLPRLGDVVPLLHNAISERMHTIRTTATGCVAFTRVVVRLCLGMKTEMNWSAKMRELGL